MYTKSYIIIKKHSFGDILKNLMQIEHLQQILCVIKVPLF